MNKTVFNPELFNMNVKEFIGTLTWWSIPAKRYDYFTFKSQIENLGLNSDTFKLESQRQTFSDALNEVADISKAEIFKIDEDCDKILYRFVSNRVDKENSKIIFDQDTLFTFIKDPVEVQAKGDQNIIDLVKTTYARYQGTIDREVICRYVLENLKNNNGISLRPSGGIYFNPTKSVNVIDKLQELIRVSEAGKISILRVPNSKMDKESTLESVKEDIMGRYGILVKQIDNIKKRLSSFDAVEVELESLKDLTDFYSEILEDEGILEECKKTYNEMIAYVAKKMEEVEKNKEKKGK